MVALNSSIQKFCKTYAAYLGGDLTSLYGNIDRERPSESLLNCNELVEDAFSRKEGNEELNGVQGIYLLVDEYDAFSNNYLEAPDITEPHKTTWDGTAVVSTFRSFWSTIKLLCSKRVKRAFITGISPLSLSGIGSAFNVGMTREHPLDNTPSYDWLHGVMNCLRHSSRNTTHNQMKSSFLIRC
jgi:hypothetical protein